MKHSLLTAVPYRSIYIFFTFDYFNISLRPTPFSDPRSHGRPLPPSEPRMLYVPRPCWLHSYVYLSRTGSIQHACRPPSNGGICTQPTMPAIFTYTWFCGDNCVVFLCRANQPVKPPKINASITKPYMRASQGQKHADKNRRVRVAPERRSDGVPRLSRRPLEPRQTPPPTHRRRSPPPKAFRGTPAFSPCRNAGEDANRYMSQGVTASKSKPTFS